MKNADFSLDLNNNLVEKFACIRNELIVTKTEKKCSFHFIQMVNTFSPPIKLHIFGLATSLLSSLFWFCMQTKCVQISGLIYPYLATTDDVRIKKELPS